VSASQLQGDPLQIARRRLDDQPAHLAAAGEGDLVHVRVCRQRRAGRLAEAGDDVHHAGRDARFLDQLTQAQR
jgi:hypothetical protein